MVNKKDRKASFIRLYGAGGHSQVIKETLNLTGVDVESYYDDYSARKHFKVPVINKGVRNDFEGFAHKGNPFIICIGNNKERAEIASLINNKYSKAIHPTAIVSENSLIGEGTVVFAGAIIQPNTKVGKHVIINTGASIDHDNIIGDYAHISPQAALCGHVEIGEGTHIGVSACVIPKVKIGKWCTIGAGAVIINDIPDYSTVVGNPGRIIKRNFPVIKNKINDLVFVGSGISSSFTLLELLEKFDKSKIDKTLNITIVEKAKEFYTGIPYGYRSSDSTLLIKPLSKFLPIDELKKFTDWLSINKSWLLSETLFCGGELIKKWYVENEKAIRANIWNDLFIPRSFFGKYITSMITSKINYLTNKGSLSVDFINDEVQNIENKNDTYLISFKQKKEKLVTKKVVLGVGSVPNRRLFATSILEKVCDYALLVEDPYNSSISNTLNRIKDFIGNKKVNILILGTNASAIELVYKLNDYSGIGSRINHFYTLSPQKKLPDFYVDYDDTIKFIPIHLINLLNSDTVVKAFKIAEACKNDLDFAEENNISAIYSIQPISLILHDLLKKLNHEEKEQFASFYGNEIGKRQREAGEHYSQVVLDLEKEKRITYMAGKFSGININETKMEVMYISKENITTSINDSIDIIINCTGGCDIKHEQNENTLLINLMSNGICKLNKSNRGFCVDNNMKASKSFYINGPLLSGNVIDNKAIWHVEHGGRIATFSKKLAEILFKDLFVEQANLKEKKLVDI
ncbi:NeuD/PglB/VioB family sugar acetyltransferase [Aquimarina agarilytica]|uniref:NeuD/PglB/VioB family sugar acetyltransferase n=1 Tax=Aquimarina agarilytica TaxID=1087449 RepID=UPI000287FAD5|nr:NeuD/PglB/VioB family sugar acetyltransferase [Aquimarina agarilytica]